MDLDEVSQFGRLTFRLDRLMLLCDALLEEQFLGSKLTTGTNEPCCPSQFEEQRNARIASYLL